MTKEEQQNETTDYSSASSDQSDGQNKREAVDLVGGLRDQRMPRVEGTPSNSITATEDHDNSTLAAGDGIPRRIGKYSIRSVLGKGGQAIALLAIDSDLERHVVLKLYTGITSAVDQDRILSEGKALARVKSPFVATCLAAERHDGKPYLVVEYISGQDLSEVLGSKRLAINETLKLIADVAEGLAAVHACGLIHRDIKPGNIILADDGRPCLVDFGLAARLASDELSKISGTPAFMSPEQARGESERIDARSDVFGLGAVLYAMLTGQAPYIAQDNSQLLEIAKRAEITPPRQLDSSISRQVSDLCMWSLEKDPRNRPQSALEFRAAIAQLQKRRSNRITIPIASLAACAMLAIVTHFLVSPTDQTAESQSAVLSTARAVHPDGRELRQDFRLSATLIGGIQTKRNDFVLSDGDRVWIRVEADRDCFVAAWAVSPRTDVVQLLPNGAEAGNQLKLGQPRIIPGAPDVAGQVGKQITASFSGEPEFIHVIAATRSIPSTSGKRFGPYVVLKGEELKEVYRTLLIEDRDDDDSGPVEVSEAIIRFQVERRQAF